MNGGREMDGFINANGKPVLLKMVSAIRENKAYLGEVDGLIGDGDHGTNMNKGFTMFGDRISGREISFTDGLEELGTLLFSEIGGSMGPIYGTLFNGMAQAGEGLKVIGTAQLADMLEAGLTELYDIVDARVGDKTLVDTLFPAKDVMKQCTAAGKSLAEALPRMKEAAAAGRDSTKNMVAKYGRSSRLGERSRGVLDAGAASCCIILTAMADGILEQIGKDREA
jgi:dihydroxyacetone kinase-like protein